MKRMITIAVLTLAMVATGANAISIPLDESGWSMVLDAQTIGGGSVQSPYVSGINNDTVTIELSKIFDHSFSGQDYEPISITFEKTSAQAVSNIAINNEYITNNTGSEWFNFHMNIVNGQTPLAGFNPGYVPDGDLLEDVSFADNSGYNNLPVQINFVDSDNQGIANYDVFLPGFMGGFIMINTDSQMQVGDSFTLQEVPSVPEPASVFLLAAGGLAMLRKKGKSVVK